VIVEYNTYRRQLLTYLLASFLYMTVPRI